MNWFTNGTISESAAAARDNSKDDLCEHVEADKTVARYWVAENDSFGIVGRCVMCTECWQKMKEAEAKEMCYCQDCKQEKPRSEVSEWRWYDFYAAQGDEPRMVCKACWVLPAHQRRMAQDKRDRDEEMGYADDEDDFDPDAELTPVEVDAHRALIKEMRDAAKW